MPLKILIISDAWHPQVNGVVRTYEHLRDELRHMGHDVKVVGPADFRFTVPLPSYPEIKLALTPKGKLKQILKSFQPDHIHIATEGPLGWAMRKLCIKQSRPFTTSYHTHFPDYVAKRGAKYLPFLYELLKSASIKVIRNFHEKAHGMYLATKTLEEDLEGWGIKTPKYRLSRGVKLDVFTPEGPKLFEKLTKPIALYVGRIAIEKNLEAFLDMDWEGSKVLVGDGPARESLHKRYPDAVFPGKKVGKDLAAHYRSADVFVFPSKTDTFGVVLIEAMACGTPVAAYPVMGPKDILTENISGVMDEDLSTAAHKALKIGQAQKRADIVHKTYTWENAANQFLAGFMTADGEYKFA